MPKSPDSGGSIVGRRQRGRTGEETHPDVNVAGRSPYEVDILRLI